MIKEDRSSIYTDSIIAERRVLAWIRAYLPEVKRGKIGEGCDLWYKGKKVEVKWSPCRSDGVWYFNIHRRNIVNEDGLHAYILRLENVPGFKYAIHLVLPAPLNTPTVTISLRSLLTKYGRYFNRLDYIEPSLQQGIGDDDGEVPLPAITSPAELRESREQLDLSRETLADICGVSKETVLAVECGEAGDACIQRIEDTLPAIEAMTVAAVYGKSVRVTSDGSYGQDLRMRRRQAHLSQHQLAALTEIVGPSGGVSYTAISFIESGRTRKPYLRTRKLLDGALSMASAMTLSEHARLVRSFEDRGFH